MSSSGSRAADRAQEPSVVAIAVNDNKIVEVGSKARDMLGRTPETIEVARRCAMA